MRLFCAACCGMAVFAQARLFAADAAPSSNLSCVASAVGFTSDELRFLPQDVFDCMREYAALPQNRDFSAPKPPEATALLQDMQKQLKQQPDIVAMMAFVGPASGTLYRRGPSGRYEAVPASKESDNLTLVAVGTQAAPPRALFPNAEIASSARNSPDEQHILVYKDGSGVVRIREVLTLSAGELIATIVSESIARFEQGTWADYLAGRGVLLSISGPEAERRDAALTKSFQSSEMKELMRRIIAMEVTEGLSEEAARQLLDECSTATIDFIDKFSAGHVSIYAKGDVLLLYELEESDSRYLVRAARGAKQSQKDDSETAGRAARVSAPTKKP